MLSDPESLAPALPLEISFTADQVWACTLTLPEHSALAGNNSA